MPKREPLYPHMPKGKTAAINLSQDDELRFLPDSPEFLAETITCIGCREKLDSVFQQAIARAKGR